MSEPITNDWWKNQYVLSSPYMDFLVISITAEERDKLLLSENARNEHWPSNGMCYHCNKDILAHQDGLDEARNPDGFISGCPWCQSSFVD